MRKAACAIGWWVLAALVVGLLAGGGSVLLAYAVSAAQRLHAAQPLLGWALPLAGLLTAGLYRALHVGWDVSTAWVIDRGRDGRGGCDARGRERGDVPAGLAPAILLGTCLTILGGGSVGKEAGALQLGGAAGSLAARLLARLRPGGVASDTPAAASGGTDSVAAGSDVALATPVPNSVISAMTEGGGGLAPGAASGGAALAGVDTVASVPASLSGTSHSPAPAAVGSRRASAPGAASSSAAPFDAAFVRMGMAAAFAVLFRAPLAGAIFVLELTRFRLRPASVLPPLLTSLCGAGVASLFPEGVLWRSLWPQALPAQCLAGTLVVALACAALAFAFCWLLGRIRRLHWGRAGGALDSPWAHMLLGGALVAAIAQLTGLAAFAGTGDALIVTALGGHAEPLAFLGKAALTLLVLGVGFKGGEIMPVLAMGATLGCAVGPLVGAEAGPCAALGATCMLAACTNCPLAAIVLGVEAFGPAMAWTLVPGCLLAYALTLPVGLYPRAPRGGDEGGPPRRVPGKCHAGRLPRG